MTLRAQQNDTIATALSAVRLSIQQAAAAAGRAPDSVRLLAVSKTFGPQSVLAAALGGQTAFGENYIQEAVEKMHNLQDLPEFAQLPALEWHCIGPVQSNKTRLVAEHFDWLHTLDRVKIAERLNAQRPPHLAPLQVCIQVNIDGSASKHGVAPEEAHALARAISAPGVFERLRLRGIMCIPDPSADSQHTAQAHRAAQALFQSLHTKLQAQAPHFDTLSLGMSADLAIAIAQGSTLVRVGSAIFGARSPLTKNGA